MDQLPTLGPVIRAAQFTARRFPLVLLAAGVAAYAAISLVEAPGGDASLERLMLTAMLGLPLLFALKLLVERRGFPPPQAWALQGIGVAVLLGLWLAWPHWSRPVQVERYVQLVVAAHLLVAFLPYAGYAEHNGFWQYNRALFERFLTAAIYSLVLFGGLAIAFLALDKLLGVPVANEGYVRLWVVIGFVFNTWFFVAGIPEDFAALESRSDYPAGLSAFTQYALLPIVAIYLTILTLYLGKVVITREWPSGWIGYLVSGVAVVGILSWLLVRPLEDRPEHRWVKTYTRWFYLAIMPAVVMLWLAIWKRVDQYGITERRYFLIVLSIWLAGIAVFYSVRRSRSIAVIPASLCVLAVLSFAGPWGAYAVSRRSQTHRLETLLAKNGILSAGLIRAGPHNIASDDRKEIAGALDYLVNTHGTITIARWFSEPQSRVLAESGVTGGSEAASSRAAAIMKRMGLQYINPRDRRSPNERFNYYASQSAAPVRISDYEYVVHFSGAASDSLPAGGGAYLHRSPQSGELWIAKEGERLLLIPVRPVVDRARAYQDANGPRSPPPELLRAESAGEKASALVIFRSLYGEIRRDGTKLNGMEGDLFLRLSPIPSR